MKHNRAESIDSYIKDFSAPVQSILQEIRTTIKHAVPDATETISYAMPAFTLQGKVLVYFAAWNDFIGFYATPSGNLAFRKELSAYQSSKGAVHFPLDQPIPYKLITQIAKFRAQELQQS